LGCGDELGSFRSVQYVKELRVRDDLTNALVVRKKEEFVFYDRAAHIPAELVKTKWCGLTGYCEEVPGVESVIPKEFEDPAVEVVRARFGNHVNDVSIRSSILGGIHTRYYVEFLYAIDACSCNSRLLPPQLQGSSVGVDTRRVRTIEENVYTGEACLVTAQARLSKLSGSD
jgi:hypothetical protein